MHRCPPVTARACTVNSFCACAARVVCRVCLNVKQEFASVFRMSWGGAGSARCRHYVGCHQRGMCTKWRAVGSGEAWKGHNGLSGYGEMGSRARRLGGEGGGHTVLSRAAETAGEDGVSRTHRRTPAAGPLPLRHSYGQRRPGAAQQHNARLTHLIQSV